MNMGKVERFSKETRRDKMVTKIEHLIHHQQHSTVHNLNRRVSNIVVLLIFPLLYSDAR